jgi:hypothetical protein
MECTRIIIVVNLSTRLRSRRPCTPVALRGVGTRIECGCSPVALGRALSQVLPFLPKTGSGVTPGFGRQTECEPCMCQDQKLTYTAIT